MEKLKRRLVAEVGSVGGAVGRIRQGGRLARPALKSPRGRRSFGGPSRALSRWGAGWSIFEVVFQQEFANEAKRSDCENKSNMLLVGRFSHHPSR